MIKIVFEGLKEVTIHAEDVDPNEPIFAKKNGKLVGMITHEERGWIVRTGGCGGATGYHKTLMECMKSCLPHGYTFYVEQKQLRLVVVHQVDKKKGGNKR
jgi:hypothetical protein